MASCAARMTKRKYLPMADCKQTLRELQAFLDGDLSFNGIAEVIERAAEAIPARPVGHFSDLYKADAAAREQAAELVHGVTA